jgi:thiol-disulfide isomerase/thioredoxin
VRKWLLAALLLASAPAAAELRPFGRGSWQELLAAHSGRPTIVHFWGLTCAPCLVELPRWGELVRERKDLDLVLVAADPLAGDEARISATLRKAGLDGAESWGFADEFAARLRFEIDRGWRGELPRTLLVGRDGAVTTLPGVADLAAVRQWLDGQSGRTPKP